MKQVILFILCLVLCTGICGRVTAQAETDGQEQQNQKDELGLYAQSAVLMDAKTGIILYGKNEGVARPMASTTKIMTCIIALEYGNLSDTVTASQNAAAQPKVHLGVYKGQTFRLEDLLYSLMLESHNDAAVMIAEHVGGSVEGFAVLMNQKARDLGCGDTYFITPNGLDASKEENGQMKEHSTTAADLARIMNYCIGTSPKKDEFLKITGTQSYYFTDQDGKRSYSCQNHNALLTMMSGVFSGKTYKWSDARKLFGYGKEHYQYREVYQEKTLPEIPVENGVPLSGNLGDPVVVHADLNLKDEEKSLKLLMAEDEEVTVSEELPDRLKAPLRKGQTVGTVTYRLQGETVKTFPVYLTEDVEKITFRWCIDRVIQLFRSPFSFVNGIAE